ncbi:hypothetical protein Ciccas_004372 [Cichlidogyrus casuarinus]|uniref:V-type proton ATPase subunit a n=1 Tax=Cichlidogyrus casuarinus TaxID=1844966 RepID=A0ABD2QBP9_9PLAT
MDRKLKFLEKEIKKDEFPILDTGENPEAPAPREIVDLESTFDKLENELKEVNSSTEQLMKTYLELTELKHILRKTQNFFSEDEQINVKAVDSAYLGLGQMLDFTAGVILRDRLPAFERMLWRACRGNVFLKQAEIETPLEDPLTGDKVHKSVFIIFFQGDQLKARVKKICEGFHATIYPCPESQADRRKITMEAVSKSEDLEVVIKQTKEHRRRILETAAKNIRLWFIRVRKIKAIYHTLNLFSLDVTTKCMVGECWSAVSDLDKIHMGLRRGMEKSSSTLQPILNGLQTKENPPTFHRTNKFTSAFQSIVDAYGVAKYQEVNPALFTVITFPFLFAIMFGDAGHGLIMFLFALWMVIRERVLMQLKTKDEIWLTFFGGRYIILLMGAFSIYTGVIYNDFFAKSMNIFGSSWYPQYSADVIQTTSVLQLEPEISPNKTQMFTGYPYPFGIDPIWQMSTNKITFTNSVKMKMSIIFGVFHMLFGVSMGVFNHRFFKQPLNIYCEFIPQIIFLASIFFYLVVMIFYKWVNFTAVDSRTAPSLLLMLIGLVMKNDQPDFYTGQTAIQTFLVVIAGICVPWMLLAKPLILRQRHKAKMAHTPATAEAVKMILMHPQYQLLVDANSSLMHAGRDNLGTSLSNLEGGIQENGNSFVSDNDQTPLHLKEEEHEDDHGHGDGSKVGQDAQPPPPQRPPPPPPGDRGLSSLEDGLPVQGSVVPAIGDQHGEDIEEFDFGETLVYQSIHTIEYCLGCISNTASYLRLWALSLAHAQLSEVLWTMVFQRGLKVDGSYGCVVLFFIFAFWAVLTVGVLIVMEGLSAFLHALRLHWVEFNNKFYAGTGYLFVPFSFTTYLEAEEAALN